ncbi:hypothetical protein P153DRAFT_374186 [Dothidotthia symphoricarpi CBS 119687]|uniref:CoA-dependent acyltransferase n=1 Tax=Dothidotthia symphoricarpi CBS 119687 TaxID=1392245 RepID=A0A6A6AHF3_9PLEO|nr:uncharacterized protein P153DRAFT_374186 [Dothidotthia symphoricarpi CBS 119687]KAF2131240.1 hypothetical protein P153DRAFT_374186 [Dothidotthia symphoricarpi CBS 119687]
MKLDVKDLEKLGLCSRLETFSTAQHHHSYYNNVGAQIHAALTIVIEKHAFLPAIPLNEDKSHPHVYFACLPSIDLRPCIEFQRRKKPFPQHGEPGQELDALLTNQHNRSFKDDIGTRPFWRLPMFYHALGDGASAILVHGTFLAGLNSLGLNLNISPFVTLPLLLFRPPFETLHLMFVSWSYFLKGVKISLLLSVFAPRPAKIRTGNDLPATTPSPPKFKFYTFVLSSSTTKQLVLISRQNGASVTSTLQCLLAASLFDNLPATDYDKVNITGPMSMRRFLQDFPEGQMTNAIMPYKYVHERLAQNSESAALTATYSYTSSATLGSPRAISAELSSIDVHKSNVKEVEIGKWDIGRMVFGQCANWTSGPFGVNVVTGGDGCARVNFCWFKGGIEEELVGKVVIGLRNGVEEFVREVAVGSRDN